MSANDLSGLSLLDEVLLAYGMQMLVCALVLVMLVGLVRRRPGRYVNWWIASWASSLVYLATAALALTAVGRMGLPASDWRRIAMSALSLVAGLLQPACMAFGSWECAHDRPIAARRRRLFLTAIVLFGVLAAVLSTYSSARLLLRLGFRDAFAGAVFMASAVMLYRHLRRRPSAGATALAWSAGLYGLGQLHSLFWTFWREVYDKTLVFPYYLGYLDVLLQVFIGLGMMVWHIETEHAVGERAQAELAQSREGLRKAQRMEVVGRVAGGVAHDFNNLLTLIYAAADGLRELHPPGSRGRELVRSLEEAMRRAKGLTAQMLAFSKRQTQRAAAVDLGEFLASSEGLLRRLLPPGIAAHFDVPSTPCWIEADASQLSQVLMNLVVNARDAMPSGGTLRLRLQVADLDAEAAGKHGVAAGAMACIEVQDDGCGIEPSVQEHIFEPFFSTKQPGSAAGSGTGLGLATVYTIVRAAGGAIEVESAAGKGALFRVLWPLVQGPATALPRPGPEPEPVVVVPRPQRILVAEDHEQIRALIVRILSARGFQVAATPDGNAALLQLQQARQRGEAHDLLITDVLMPGMGGGALIAAVRGLVPHLPILAVSGFIGDLESASVPEDVVWLQKPFGAKELLAALQKALAAAPRSGEAAEAPRPQET